MRTRAIRSGEALAIDPKAIRAGREAFFWLWSAPDLSNERVGENKDIAVVKIQGPLEHHRDGQGDCYDSIKERVNSALTGEDCEGEAATPPQCVILRIDSPGGVVSGLNECVFALRKMSAEAKVPLIAFVDEMAASAAYAMACACEEIYLPPSGIAGSIGVISTMVSQSRADEAMGLDFKTLTSGARKSDGHPHVPITDAATNVEQKRVDKLAKQFYRLVQTARGLSPKVIASYEAGIFVGDEAVQSGLADGVMGWDDIVSTLSDASSQLGGNTKSNSDVADPLVKRPKVKREEAKAMLKLANLIKTTKAALASEKDEKKLAALKTKLAAFEATLSALSPESSLSAKMTHVIEHKERKTSDDGEDDDKDEDDSDDESDEDEESEESAESKGNETDRSDKPEDDEEEDDEEDEESEASSEESEEEAAAAKTLRAALAGVPNQKVRAQLRGQLDSVLAKASKFDKMGARLAQLEKDAKAKQKAALIDGALAKRRITPGEAKQLRTKSMAMVKGFLEMRPKAIVHSTQEDLAIPKSGAKGGLSPELMTMFQNASMASNGSIPVEKFIEDYRASVKNGVGSGEY